MPEEPDKEKKLWKVDPTMYAEGRRAGFLERRIVPPLRQAGKFTLISLALTYPIYLIYIGLVFGGIGFWLFLAGSFAVIGFVISRLGYASNFRTWGGGTRGMFGLVLGCLVALGFYAGIIYLRIWLIPSILIVASLGLYFAIRRFRS